MALDYEPKTPYLSEGKVRKLIKDEITQCGRDRDAALDAYAYFKDKIDTTPERDEDGRIVLGLSQDKAADCAIHALKLAQTSTNNVSTLLKTLAAVTKPTAITTSLTEEDETPIGETLGFLGRKK